MSITIKISSKKIRLFNAFKQKSIKKKPRSEIIVINSLDNSNNKLLPTLTLTSTFNIDKVDVIMIDADAYHMTCKLKGAQVFVISLIDLKS